MSLESARHFRDKAKKTPEIRKELQEGKRGVVEVGKEHGFDFTSDEFSQALREGSSDATEGDSWCSVM